MHKGIIIIIVLVNIGCNSEEEFCGTDLPSEIENIQLGEFDYYFEKEIVFDLKEEVCLVGQNKMICLPFNTEENHYVLDNISANKFQYNEFDTIITIDNSFYKLFPTSRTLEYLFTPQFTIHDFCLTPDHGICFVWGNVFVEPPKFNYYNFKSKINTTLFTYSEFIPDGDIPYDFYQTYLDDSGNLKLFMGTKDVNNFTATDGVIYKINLDELIIEDRLSYSNKESFKVLSYNDFKILDVTYQTGDRRHLAEFNYETNLTNVKYSFLNNFLSTSYSIDNDYLSIVYHDIDLERKIEFINWRSNEKLFSIPTLEDYDSPLSEVKGYNNKYFFISNSRSNTALIYDNTGCIKYKIISGANISNIINLNSNKIILRNENDQIEYFKID